MKSVPFSKAIALYQMVRSLRIYLIEKTASGSGGPHGCSGGVVPLGWFGLDRPSYQGRTRAGADRITWARPGQTPPPCGGNEWRFSSQEPRPRTYSPVGSLDLGQSLLTGRIWTWTRAYSLVGSLDLGRNEWRFSLAERADPSVSGIARHSTNRR